MARARAGALRCIRAFFDKRAVLEVETPSLSRGACPDRHIELFCAGPHAAGATARPETRLLQSSPELYMKRLLAAGYPDIYQVCRVFRQEERGRVHNPEFTILEWYRRGFTLRQIMEEAAALCCAVAGERPVVFRTYRDIVREHIGLDPLETDLAAVLRYLRERDPAVPELSTLTDALQYLMARCVEPRLPRDAYVCVYLYPAAQAVLATLDERDPHVARRFELYAGGMEIANGWEELADPAENARRMTSENEARKAMGKATVDVLPGFAEALQAGLPACSGVALGVDRLVMLATSAASIEQVVAFPWERA